MLKWKEKLLNAHWFELRAAEAPEKQEIIVTDPNGSYTGRPLDSAERPIQDADDL